MTCDPYKLDTPARVSFSGGRTSGYLLYHVLQAFGGKLPDDVLVTFANTGREVEATLDFVRDCERHWGVRVRWLEYCRDRSKPLVIYHGKQPRIGQHSFKEVTYGTASRNGEPFTEVLEVLADFRREAKGEPPILPNPVQRLCTGYLKQKVMQRFMRAEGHDSYTVAVGIRHDERRRLAALKANATQDVDYEAPLCGAGVVLDDVLRFWEQQPFDLQLKHDPVLGTYEGNCDFCFLKKAAKIKKLAVERPEAVKWWADLERKTGQTFRKDRFSMVDLHEGRVPLEVRPAEAQSEDETTCFCTD